MLPGHTHVQYLPLLLLFLLLRIDPLSAQAAAAALPLWEAIHRTPAR